MKIYKDHVKWGWYDYPENIAKKYNSKGDYAYYFYFKPNWLKKEYRHLGIQKMWYDGPHVSLGFWFFNLTWSTQWTTFDWEDE